jgi:hypothetical protein
MKTKNNFPNCFDLFLSIVIQKIVLVNTSATNLLDTSASKLLNTSATNLSMRLRQLLPKTL